MESIFKALIIGIILSIVELLVIIGLALSGFFGDPGTHGDLFGFALGIFWLASSLVTITISFIIGLIIAINRKIKSKKKI